MRALREEELVALSEYASKHGRFWKSKLRDEWLKATAEPILHALRNTHGPSWLDRFKLPR